MSLIIEGLYLGDYRHASSRSWLKENGMTHIVNCAVEHKNYFPNDFIYLELKLDDAEDQIIYGSLEKSYLFIKNALERGSNVLCHCHAGISRSSSMVIYYIMKSRNIPYDTAYFYTKHKRHVVNPNKGFIRQLISVTPQVRNNKKS